METEEASIATSGPAHLPEPTPEPNEARLFFFLGLLGLPWLWAVSAMFQFSTYGHKRVNAWAWLSLAGAIFAFLAWFVWFVYFETTWRAWVSSAVGLMLNVPAPDVSKW